MCPGDVEELSDLTLIADRVDVVIEGSRAHLALIREACAYFIHWMIDVGVGYECPSAHDRSGGLQ